MKSKYIVFFVTLLVFLLFLKIDFRLTNELKCCNDDFDYFSHAVTIAEDFDLDYSNQLPDKSRFYRNDKNAPFGFIGTGLLSAPFIFIGNLLDKIIFFEGDKQFSLKYLTYSFSSIFYFLVSLNLIRKIQLFYEVKSNYLLYFIGSGVTYYLFERYSMTPIYEIFSILCIIFFTQKFQNEPNKIIYSLILPIFLLLAILVRWTNFYVFLIPFIVILSTKNFKWSNILKLFNRYFVFSIIFNFLLFVYLSFKVYGVVTFSPSYIYMIDEFDGLISTNIFQNFLTIIIEFFRDLLIVLFTQEFGLFWFSPIIFTAFLIVVYKVLHFKNLQSFTMYFLSAICFLQNFFIVSIWNSTASSYGFRYLFSLVPLSLLIIFINKQIINKTIVKNYLFYFSLFAFISTLFFDATPNTSLSLDPVLNSFGYEKVYSQPKYLSGVIESIFIFDSYFKIFGTSYLFLLSYKFFVDILKISYFEQFVINFQNANIDVANLITQINQLNSFYFVFVLVIVIFASLKIVNHLIKS